MKWYSSADPKVLAKTMPRVGIAVVAIFLIVIILSGRASLLIALAPVLLLLFMRFKAFKNRFKAAMGPQPGQTSEVVTRYFRMTLDHDSNDLNGEVLDGAFVGRMLNDLSPEELSSLWEEIVVDGRSASVMESYLNRRLGPDWQYEFAGKEAGADQRERSGWERGSSGGQESADIGSSGVMTPQQAYEILGLEPGASDQEIRDAHRRLLQKIHPDHGGSNFLAAQINRAKDILLKD